jgi:nucleotide-binding universal stress UspA family protein
MESMKHPSPPFTPALSSDPTVVIYGGPSRRATREIPVESTAAARGASSVVVGVDGSERRIRSVLLGSVSRSLVQSAACPMVVVPRVGSTEASASVAGRLA